MGFFDKFSNHSSNKWSYLTSDKTIQCERCGKTPLLKQADVYSAINIPNILTDTINFRAGKCSNCSKIVCVECAQKFGKTLSNGKKGCPFCGSIIDIL
jgi:DNA-directed RNA polymerase subunit RPC12/RpoP